MVPTPAILKLSTDTCTSKHTTAMSQNEPSISGGPMPIAVIGMGFRGPGEAKDLDSLWEMLEAKREAWSPVPKDRWNNEAFYHPDPNRMGTVSMTVCNLRGQHKG